MNPRTFTILILLVGVAITISWSLYWYSYNEVREVMALIAPEFILYATSSSDDEDGDDSNNNDNEDQRQVAQEKCTVTLQTGEYIVLNKPQDVELSDGTVLKGHNCEQLQQDWANTTYADYQDWLNEINQAGEELGKKFAPKPSLIDQLQELNENLEELNARNR